MRTLVLPFVLMLCALSSAIAEDGWPQFRGPAGNGIANENQAITNWSEAENVQWRASIPGVGWSSPVAEGDTIWLTTAVLTEMTAEEQQAVRDRDYADHMIGDALVFVKDVAFHAIGVNGQTGKVENNVLLFRVENPTPVHTLNSYASPTPVIADGKLYCHFGSFGTVCLDTATERLIWKAKLQHNESVGPGSSLALHKGMLLIPCDGVDKQFVVGLDCLTGKERWRTPRPPMEGNEPEYHKSFSTATVMEHGGRTQAVILGAQWIVSYDPDTGEEWWRLRHGKGFSCSCRSIYGNGLIYVCTGYGDGLCLAIDPSGSGELGNDAIRWSHRSQVPTMSSPILIGDRLYFVSNAGVATCLDAITGDRIWRNRLGGNYCASPIAVGQTVYFSSREGMTTAIRAGDEFQKVAKNELDEAIMASPMVLGNDIVIRTESQLYRFGN